MLLSNIQQKFGYDACAFICCPAYCYARREYFLLLTALRSEAGNRCEPFAMLLHVLCPYAAWNPVASVCVLHASVEGPEPGLKSKYQWIDWRSEPESRLSNEKLSQCVARDPRSRPPGFPACVNKELALEICRLIWVLYLQCQPMDVSARVKKNPVQFIQKTSVGLRDPRAWRLSRVEIADIMQQGTRMHAGTSSNAGGLHQHATWSP